MKQFTFVTLVFLLFLSYTALAQGEHDKKFFGHFVSCLIGDFTEGTVKMLDSSETTLRMHHIYLDTWESTDSTVWIYEEINYLKNEDKNFRQMVLQVHLLDSGRFQVSNYLIQKPWLFKNAYKDENLKRQLSPEYIASSSTCSVIFKRTAKDVYTGSTGSKGCPNHFHNAATYTTVAKLTEGSFKFWDRGFDSEGVQVWGKDKNGYEFIRTIILNNLEHSKLAEAITVPE